MNILGQLVANIIPLYGLILLGYIAGRWLDVNLRSIARINLFILLPLVSFGAIVRIKFDPAYILLPFALSGIAILLTLVCYQVSKRIWTDGNANLIGSGTVNGNALYFGLPVILYLFGTEGAGIYLFMNMGPQICNVTLGYFLTARGGYSVRDSLVRVVKFPAVHATWLAILVNLAGWHPPAVFTAYWEHVVGALIVLGMMMVGIALGRQEKFEIDLKLLSAFFISKFLLWPLACLAFIYTDHLWLHLFDHKIYRIIMIFSAMPLIGNLVAYAAEHNLHPQRAAAAVLLSSFFALITVPAAYLLSVALFG